jgi:hypothetical protein
MCELAANEKTRRLLEQSNAFLFDLSESFGSNYKTRRKNMSGKKYSNS